MYRSGEHPSCSARHAIETADSIPQHCLLQIEDLLLLLSALQRQVAHDGFSCASVFLQLSHCHMRLRQLARLLHQLLVQLCIRSVTQSIILISVLESICAPYEDKEYCCKLVTPSSSSAVG